MEYLQVGALNSDFRTCLHHLMTHGLEAHPRGTTTRELLNYNITLADPRNRIINFPDRKTDLKYLLGEFIKSLSSSKMAIFEDTSAIHQHGGVGVPVNGGVLQFVVLDNKLHLIATSFEEVIE